MSAAADDLAVGFEAHLSHFGEDLEFIPASAVVRNESGEAVTDENGKAVLSDDTTTEFRGEFDEAYQLASPENAMVVSTVIAVIARSSAGITAGCPIIRDDVTYYVTIAQEPSIDGSQVFLLSKQIQ